MGWVSKENEYRQSFKNFCYQDEWEESNMQDWFSDKNVFVLCIYKIKNTIRRIK